MKFSFPDTLTSIFPGNIAGDISFFLIFLCASLTLAFVLGRTRLISMVMYSYVAFAFIQSFPKNMFLLVPHGETLAFFLLLTILVIIGDYIVDIHISIQTSTFLTRIFIMGILGSGLVLSFSLSLVSKIFALQFISLTVYDCFSSPVARIFWMMAPLVFLFFINKRKI